MTIDSKHIYADVGNDKYIAPCGCEYKIDIDSNTLTQTCCSEHSPTLLHRIKESLEEINKELNGRVPDYEITGNLDDAWQSCAYKCSEILRKKFPEAKED